ncbi:MAG: radical SAM protein [Candidatus Omnitrophica bacterium]|nr:radical SAM protein [Candidatus Omnitrophota bacterium]
MRLSNHTIIVSHYPRPGEHLLFSTRTQAMVKIDQDLRDILGSLERYGDDLSLQRAEDLRRLHTMGILVQNEEEEQAKLKNFFHQLKYGYNRAVFPVTILTTASCNFKCVYCFEESSREGGNLDFETRELVIGWLKRRVERLGYKGLVLNYYGGEPLLYPQAIEHISSEMKQWCRSKGLNFAVTLQTNGYLMTPEAVAKLTALGLKRVRVSVDGARERHDRNRPLRGGGPTFDRIIRNIQDCADKLEICVSMGYEKDDIGPIAALVEYLDELGVLHKLGEFICSPIIPSLGPKGRPQAIRGSECMFNQEDHMMAAAVGKIKELMDRHHLKYTCNMSVNACGLVRENSGVTIDQHGRLFRCNSLLGHPEFAVGDVRHDEFNETQKEFRDLDAWKQCPVDCTYLPMCSGGCRLLSFVGGNKNFKTVSCKELYLNEMAPQFIKRQYEQTQAQKKELEQENIMV